MLAVDRLPSDAAVGDGPLPPLLLRLPAPRGFCAGVTRAIDAVSEALRRHGPPVYVRRPVVHNLRVVRALEAEGAIFVQELDQVPEGALVILSAHGVSREVIAEAERRGLRWFDAVCPLVSKVHREVVQSHADGRHVILIGHEGHPEIAGTLGQVPEGAATVASRVEEIDALPIPRDAPVAYAVQTTFSVDDAQALVDALQAHFTDIRGPRSSDICYATTNRQRALRAAAMRADAVIVAGERFSSNASRLAEVAVASGCASVQLVSEPSEIDWTRLEEVRTLALTSAASTPESTVSDIVAALRLRFEVTIEEVEHLVENISFKPLSIS